MWAMLLKLSVQGGSGFFFGVRHIINPPSQKRKCNGKKHVSSNHWFLTHLPGSWCFSLLVSPSQSRIYPQTTDGPVCVKIGLPRKTSINETRFHFAIYITPESTWTQSKRNQSSQEHHNKTANGIIIHPSIHPPKLLVPILEAVEARQGTTQHRPPMVLLPSEQKHRPRRW